VVVLPGRNDEDITVFEHLLDEANVVLREMVEQGRIQVERMALAAFPRQRSDLLAPFPPRSSANSTVEFYDLAPVQDAARAGYQRDKDQQVQAIKRGRFSRSLFIPTWRSGWTTLTTRRAARFRRCIWKPTHAAPGLPPRAVKFIRPNDCRGQARLIAASAPTGQSSPTISLRNHVRRSV
jgi:hypothetical protein